MFVFYLILFKCVCVCVVCFVWWWLNGVCVCMEHHQDKFLYYVYFDVMWQINSLKITSLYPCVYIYTVCRCLWLVIAGEWLITTGVSGQLFYPPWLYLRGYQDLLVTLHVQVKVTDACFFPQVNLPQSTLPPTSKAPKKAQKRSIQQSKPVYLKSYDDSWYKWLKCEGVHVCMCVCVCVKYWERQSWMVVHSCVLKIEYLSWKFKLKKWTLWTSFLGFNRAGYHTCCRIDVEWDWFNFRNFEASGFCKPFYNKVPRVLLSPWKLTFQ